MIFPAPLLFLCAPIFYFLLFNRTQLIRQGQDIGQQPLPSGVDYGRLFVQGCTQTAYQVRFRWPAKHDP